jgi:hypothetical protein
MARVGRFVTDPKAGERFFAGDLDSDVSRAAHTKAESAELGGAPSHGRGR